MRYYLTIPFDIKDTIKACYDIHWDRDLRRWYAEQAYDAVHAQDEANVLAAKWQQDVPTEWREAAEAEERAARALYDTSDYTGRLLDLRVSGAGSQKQRIAQARELLKPRRTERTYLLRIDPADEPSFTVEFGAADDAQATGFAKAVWEGKTLAGLVYGDIAGIAATRKEHAAALAG